LKKKSIVYERAYEVAKETVSIYKELHSNHHYDLGKQLLKSGTSVAANIREALDAQSDKDFISKMSIALKESNETDYWLNLLVDTDIIKKDRIVKCFELNHEVLKMLNKIIKTSKKNMQK